MEGRPEARNAPEQRSTTRQVGTKEGDGTVEVGSKCVLEGVGGLGMWCDDDWNVVGRGGSSFYQGATVEMPVVSTSRHRWRKTEDQRKWVHEV